MNKISKEETIIKESIEKINTILSLSNELIFLNEKIILKIIRFLFNDDEELFHYLKKENENDFNLVNKFIELLALIFSLPLEMRKDIYKTNINTINNPEIVKIVIEITKILDGAKYIKNDNSNLDKLYEIIFSIPKENLGELINFIFALIGYIVFHSTQFLSYILFFLLQNKYLVNDKIKDLNFEDNNINLNNDVCTNLLIDECRY